MDIGLAFFTFIYRNPFARSMACIYIFITANLKFTISACYMCFPICVCLLARILFSSQHLPQSDQNQDEGSHETLREFSLSTILAVTLQCLLLWHDRSVTKSLNIENCLSCQKVRRFNLKKLSSIPTTWFTSQEKIVH